MYNLGKVWNDWKIVKLIGEGSFGKVYEIVRNNFGVEERSALKVIQIPNSTAEVQSLKSEGMDDKSLKEYYISLVEDFSREIEMMVMLKGNPGIVACEDYRVIEHENGFGWDILIRMELLTPLSKITAERELSEAEVTDLGISLCDALAVCHHNSIIHRDIKIDNIFVSDSGFYKLGDFGVARTIDKTAAGLSKKGTYTYMAPEVYRGEPYGRRADIYSLGLVMYRLLNHNREPFLPSPPASVKYTDKNHALIRRMRGERFMPPQKASRELGNVIMRACEYNVYQRYPSAEELKNALIRVKSGSSVIGREAPQVHDPAFPPQNTAPKKQRAFGSYTTPAVFFGWFGIMIEILGIVVTKSYEWVNPLAILAVIAVSLCVLAVTLILFTFKKYSKAVWVIMLVSSVLSLSIINVISTYLLYNAAFYSQKR